jgi:hypothetical protein
MTPATFLNPHWGAQEVDKFDDGVDRHCLLNLLELPVIYVDVDKDDGERNELALYQMPKRRSVLVALNENIFLYPLAPAGIESSDPLSSRIEARTKFPQVKELVSARKCTKAPPWRL